MNTSLLAFLSATVFFVPAGSVPAPTAAASPTVQSGQSRFGGVSRGEMIDVRNRFGGAIDGIRANLEQSLLAIDLSDPAMVTEFVDGQRLLGAWDAMATLLPHMTDEELEATRAPLKELGRLFDLLQRIAATASVVTPGTPGQISQRGGNTRAIGAVGVGACSGKEYNSTGTRGFFATSGWINAYTHLLTILFSVYTPAELMEDFDIGVGGFLQGNPIPSGNALYLPGIKGEQQAKDVQALLDYYAGMMPDTSMVVVATESILVRNPLKLVFDIFALKHRREEIILAESNNADFAACQLAELATAVDDIDMANITGRFNTVDANLALTARELTLKARADAIDASVALRSKEATLNTRADALDASLALRSKEATLITRANAIDASLALKSTEANLNARADAIDARLLAIELLLLDDHDHDHDHDDDDDDDDDDLTSSSVTGGGGKAK